MKITPNFDTAEFGQPAKYGFSAQVYPAIWVQPRLLPLCQILEFLRAELKAPIRITEEGGYRTTAYNRKMYAIIGKAATHSQHSQGRAADIVVTGILPSVVHDTLLRLHNEGVIKLGGLGKYATFTHVDIRPQVPKGHLARWSDYGS